MTKTAPTAFSLLRPIAILPNTAKLWSPYMFEILAEYDQPDPSRTGFKNGHFCAELLSVMRLVIEPRITWGMDTHVAQVDIARAYDSIHHPASMFDRHFALAHTREARRA